MADFGGAGGAEDDRDDVETAEAVVDLMDGLEVAGGSGHAAFLGGGDRRLGGDEGFAGAGFDFDEDEHAVGVDHDKVKLAGLAGEIAGQGPQPFVLEESLTPPLPPAAQSIPVGQQSATIEDHGEEPTENRGIRSLIFDV